MSSCPMCMIVSCPAHADNLRKVKFIIEIETDADEDALEELLFLMKIQVESLNDGTMELPGDGDDETEVVADFKYRQLGAKYEHE